MQASAIVEHLDELEDRAPHCDIESGIAWAANNGAKVINMSLGAFIACPASTEAATNYAWSKGVVIVAAAGNDGQNGESAPANCPNVIGVAAAGSVRTQGPVGV